MKKQNNSKYKRNRMMNNKLKKWNRFNKMTKIQMKKYYKKMNNNRT